MLGKVLIFSASAGAGHLRAAQAIERAMTEMNAVADVHHFDVLQYTNKLFRTLYSKVYIEMAVKAPKTLGWLYDKFDTPWENERRRLALDKLNTRPFIKLLKQYQPDLVVCTHFLPAEIVSWLTAKNRIHCPQAIVVTDFYAHAMWLAHHYQQYFVPADETRVYLEQLGIDADKISVTGIPIDPLFSRPKDKRDMRNKHELRQDTPAILISAGGFGVGPVSQILQALMQVKHPIQVVAVCGRNEELQAEVEKIAAEIPNDSQVRVKPIGYTTEMDEYMAAADILLGKPGGLTTSEALAMGLVFVVMNPIPGQEERNSDHLLEAGAAIRCNSLLTLAYKIDTLLDDPARFAAMRQKALQIAHPRAAFAVVEKLLALNNLTAK